MDSKRAAEVLSELEAFYRAGEVCLESTAAAVSMGSQALEAWAWVEREKATVQPLGAGWTAETLDDDGRWVIGEGPTPLAAVLDAMEKEKGNG